MAVDVQIPPLVLEGLVPPAPPWHNKPLLPHTELPPHDPDPTTGPEPTPRAFPPIVAPWVPRCVVSARTCVEKVSVIQIKKITRHRWL